MAFLPEAKEVRLKNTRPLAPPFHRHLAKSRLMGRPCRVGDRVIVYEVVFTDPEGPVEVTPRSLLVFE